MKGQGKNKPGHQQKGMKALISGGTDVTGDEEREGQLGSKRNQ